MFFKNLYAIGDRFEDRARSRLSHVPLIYAALGGAGIILFWRGIWHTVDYIIGYFFATSSETVNASISELPWWDGPLSIALGAALLLSIGLFVTSFIGDAIIVSGLKHDKKLTEKTEEEVFMELRANERIYRDIHEIDRRIRHIETSLGLAKPPGRGSKKPMQRGSSRSLLDLKERSESAKLR